MNYRQSGFGKSKVIIILLGLLIIIAAIFIWRNQKALAPTKSTVINNYADCVKAGKPVMESYPTQCFADGKTYVNTDQKVPTAENITPVQKYLTIKEWGVRIPISKADNDDDMVYTFKSNDTYQSAFFTFQRLIDYGICNSDIGVAMTRSKTKNEPPYDIGNPAQFAHLGEYYYSVSYGGSYCYDSENPKETDFYKSTGITSSTVTNALQKLELTPAQ